MRYDSDIIKQQINNLLLLFPELTEDEILRADTIEAETELHEFLRQLEIKRQDAVTLAKAIDITIDTLKQRKARFERRDEAMRNLMFSMMQTADLKKLEMPEATLSIRAGTPRVIIIDEALLPDELCRIKREPDKAKIKEILMNGAMHGAVLSNPEPVLSIRTK